MISFENFGGVGPPLHFLHANGYPPKAYQPLIERLSAQNTIMAMHMRPLWAETQPAELRDWLPLAGDLELFIEQQGLARANPARSNLAGAGHSVGATTTLRLALRQPSLFRALVLIDPVLFPPWMILFWNLIDRLGLAYRTHPLIRKTLRRQNRFANRQEMFDKYREKTIFAHLSDESLWAYINSLACDGLDGSVQLCISPEWEARIYATGVLRDLAIWRDLPQLRVPVLLLRGEHSNAFWRSSARRFQRLTDNRPGYPPVQIITIPGATHLLPLEQPETVARLMIHFLRDLPDQV